jgi:hypothetical protein
VDAHCVALRAIYEEYRTHWVAVAKPFIAALRPAGLPAKAVYPFGGGDLVTALTVFPDAEEITTLSLEPAGDVRHITTVPPLLLRSALGLNDRNLGKLLGISYSNTVNLGKGGRALLPGEIVLLMGALVVHGYEPVALRYFGFEPDGRLHYLSAAELDAEGKRARRAPKEGADAAFADVEIRFRKAGTPGPDKIVRHIAHDLANREIGKAPGLRAYLESRGAIASMTKAATHLLWSDDFSTIRDYLLAHTQWMVSDSTGIPPRFAGAAGFAQDTLGEFYAPTRYGTVNDLDTKAFRELFASNPKRALPFQFGYRDVRHQSHMVVMHKARADVAPPLPPGSPAPAAPPLAPAPGASSMPPMAPAAPAAR